MSHNWDGLLSLACCSDDDNWGFASKCIKEGADVNLGIQLPEAWLSNPFYNKGYNLAPWFHKDTNGNIRIMKRPNLIPNLNPLLQAVMQGNIKIVDGITKLISIEEKFLRDAYCMANFMLTHEFLNYSEEMLRIIRVNIICGWPNILKLKESLLEWDEDKNRGHSCW